MLSAPEQRPAVAPDMVSQHYPPHWVRALRTAWQMGGVEAIDLVIDEMGAAGLCAPRALWRRVIKHGPPQSPHRRVGIPTFAGWRP